MKRTRCLICNAVLLNATTIRRACPGKCALRLSRIRRELNQRIRQLQVKVDRLLMDVSEQTISAIVNRKTHNHGLAESIRRRKMGGRGKPKKEKIHGTF